MDATTAGNAGRQNSIKPFIQCVAGVVLAAACMLHAPAPSRVAGNGPFILRPIPYRVGHHRQAPRMRFWDGTSLTDLNWSGYAVETNFARPASGAVTYASGSWTVPAVTGSGSTDTYSSAWVGIDGDSSDTVEQIGTEQDWTPQGAVYYVWFEMYPDYGYEIEGFPIAPGNVFSAQVQYLGGTTIRQGRRSVANQVFQLTITNVSQNVTFTVPLEYTEVTFPTARSSAEWIMEAPSDEYGILPMADYGTVSFADCEATLRGVTGPISDGSWQNEAITASDDDTLSTPSGLTSGGTAFTITWSK